MGVRIRACQVAHMCRYVRRLAQAEWRKLKDLQQDCLILNRCSGGDLTVRQR
jgi:hypothetical protein